VNRAFQDALKAGDLALIRRVPKADLHNHGMLGGSRPEMERHYGRKLPDFRAEQQGIRDLNHWIFIEFRPFFDLEGAYEKAVEAAFIQARNDGVAVLEMSVDIYFNFMMKVSAGESVRILQKCHRETAPEIDFRPEIGFPRTQSPESVLGFLEPYFETGYFRSIDLYDDESARPAAHFREIYRFAHELGMKCKAHVGEFGDAGSVREAVEILDLDAVQHGIGAAGDPSVMKWLADRGTRLNVCPTSNLKLLRVNSYREHPIRILYDHGVKVTVNTDDALVFGDGNSEQFLRLYSEGVFTAKELDEIRLTGLGN